MAILGFYFVILSAECILYIFRKINYLSTIYVVSDFTYMVFITTRSSNGDVNMLCIGAHAA